MPHVHRHTRNSIIVAYATNPAQIKAAQATKQQPETGAMRCTPWCARCKCNITHTLDSSTCLGQVPAPRRLAFKNLSANSYRHYCRCMILYIRHQTHALHSARLHTDGPAWSAGPT
jgi:hypothetical protein